MGAELDQFSENLDRTYDAYGGIGTALTAASLTLFGLKQAAGRFESANIKAKKIDDTVENLKSTINLLGKFPAFKTVSKAAKKTLETLEKSTDKLTEELNKLDKVVQDYKDGWYWYGKGLTAASLAVGNAKGDIARVQEGVDKLAQSLVDARINSPDEAAAIEAEIEALIASLPAFPEEKLQEFLDVTSRMASAMAEFNSVAEVIDVVADGLDAVYEKIGFLAAPLAIVADALDGFLWVLDKADAVISFFLDPILDPLMEALKIDDIFEELGDAIADLLPGEIDLLPDGDGFAEKIFHLFGAIPDIEQDLTLFGFDIGAIFEFKDDVIGSILWEGGYVAPLLKDGTLASDVLIPTLLDASLEGDTGGDTIIGSDADNRFEGGSGDDWFVGSAGSDLIRGGDGYDVFYVDAPFTDFGISFVDAYMYYNQNFGYTRIDETGLALYYQGTDADLSSRFNIIDATYLIDIEKIIFGDSAFTFAELSDARYVDYRNNDEVHGDDGNNLLFGDYGDDIMVGYDGNDRFIGFDGNDTMYGNNKDPAEGPLAGDDSDTVDYASEGLDRTYLVVLDPSDPNYVFSTDTLIDIENVLGGRSGDRIVGDHQVNVLNGGGGDDVVLGGAGDDNIIGGIGSDRLTGGDGNDLIRGGYGKDHYLSSRGNDIFNDFPTTNDTDSERFNGVYYSLSQSDFQLAFVSPSGGQTPNEFLTQMAQWDAGFLDDMPDSIELKINASGHYQVEKTFGDTVETDLLLGRFNILATDAAETFALRNATDIIDGSAGHDVFRGHTPIEGTVPEDFGNALLFGSAGDDTLITSTLDENFVGGTGSDRLVVRADFTKDYAADGEDGPRTRWFIAGNAPEFTFDEDTQEWAVAPSDNPSRPLDSGTDIIDLTRTNQSWFFDFEYGAGEDFPHGVMASVLDVEEFRKGNTVYYDDLTDIMDQVYFSGVETVYGSDQVDWIENVVDDLRFVGNGGADRVGVKSGTTASLYADGGDGDDLLYGGGGFDSLIGGAGNDYIVAQANNEGRTEHVWGNEGNDTIWVASEESDTGELLIDGGSGLDTILFNSFYEVDNLGNTIISSVIPAHFDVTTGRLTVGDYTAQVENVEAYVLSEGAGTVDGSARADIISGGFGQEIINGGGGNDLLFTGYNWRYDDFPPDVINGDQGDDIIHYNNLAAYVDGGDGFDTLRLGGALDVNTGQGFFIDYNHLSGANRSLGATVFDVNAGYFEYRSTDWVDFENIEAFVGSTGSEHFIAADADSEGNGSIIDGFNGWDVMVGGTGKDTLSGGRHNDLLSGGDAEDVLTPGSGHDRVDGGAGHDILNMRFGSLGIDMDVATGLASYDYYEEYFGLPNGEHAPEIIDSSLRFENVEEFLLSESSDSFKGSHINETIFGYDGDDRLEGGGGIDMLVGGHGDDRLMGFGGTATGGHQMVYMNQDNDRVDYLRADNIAMPTSAITFEMMLNGKMLDYRNDREYALISYAGAGSGGSTNEWTIFFDSTNDTDVGILRFIINGEFYDAPIPTTDIIDGLDHRLSLTWDSANGALQVYIDGALQWETTVSTADYTTDINRTGILIIGQDQDSYGGRLDPRQAFVGGVGDIRIFDGVESAQNIAARADGPLSKPNAISNLTHYWTVDASSQAIVTEKGATLSATAPSDGMYWKDIHTQGIDGDDHLDGGFGNDILEGNAGNDILFDPIGDNRLFGGGGADKLITFAGENMLNGGGSADLLIGGIGSDNLLGGSGNDVIVADVSKALFGADTLTAGSGTDLLEGGLGSDTFVFARSNGTNHIGDIDVDYSTPSQSEIVGSDFQVGIDRVDVTDFGFSSFAQISDNLSTIDGNAHFVANGTSIIFHGVTANALSSDDFFF